MTAGLSFAGIALKVPDMKYNWIEDYMNKNHWISVDLNGEVPDETLKEMINQSYQLVLSSLSKTIQNKIIGG